MPSHTVNTDVLDSPHVRHYFETSDRRHLTGLRYALDTLGLPFPDYAAIRKPGPTPGSKALAAYLRDNPEAASSARAADLERRKR